MKHSALATFKVLPWAVAAVVLSACTVTDVQRSPTLPKDASWALLPMVNYSEAPQAGQRAEAILSTLMRKRGVSNLQQYPTAVDVGGLPDLNDRKRLDSAMEWARGSKLDYGVRGTVSEWQYKSGLDGEPAVGLSLEVVDLASGQVIWSASGADSGWGYDAASGVAQSLLSKLVGGLPLR